MKQLDYVNPSGLGDGAKHLRIIGVGPDGETAVERLCADDKFWLDEGEPLAVPAEECEEKPDLLLAVISPCEGAKRESALAEISKMRNEQGLAVIFDADLFLPPEGLLPFADAVCMTDTMPSDEIYAEILSAVRLIINMSLMRCSIVGLDFQAVLAVMKNAGICRIASARESGENAVLRAAERVAEGESCRPKAHGCLIGINDAIDYPLADFEKGIYAIADIAAKDATITWSVYFENGEAEHGAEVICIFGKFENEKKVTNLNIENIDATNIDDLIEKYRAEKAERTERLLDRAIPLMKTREINIAIDMFAELAAENIMEGYYGLAQCFEALAARSDDPSTVRGCIDHSIEYYKKARALGCDEGDACLMGLLYLADCYIEEGHTDKAWIFYGGLACQDFDVAARDFAVDAMVRYVEKARADGDGLSSGVREERLDDDDDP